MIDAIENEGGMRLPKPLSLLRSKILKLNISSASPYRSLSSSIKRPNNEGNFEAKRQLDPESEECAKDVHTGKIWG